MKPPQHIKTIPHRLDSPFVDIERFLPAAATPRFRLQPTSPPAGEAAVMDRAGNTAATGGGAADSWPPNSSTGVLQSDAYSGAGLAWMHMHACYNDITK
jgi:hypothetical protein